MHNNLRATLGAARRKANSNTLRFSHATASPFDQARHAHWTAKRVPNLPAWQKTCAAQPFHCEVVCMGRRQRASFGMHAWRRPCPGQAGIPDGLQPFRPGEAPTRGPLGAACWLPTAATSATEPVQRTRNLPWLPAQATPPGGCAARKPCGKEAEGSPLPYSMVAQTLTLATCTVKQAQSSGGRLARRALVSFCCCGLPKGHTRRS